MGNDGLCECGCGEKTSRHQRGNARKGIIKGDHSRFILGHSSIGKKREKSHNWKGGVCVNGDGYVMVYNHGHPRSSSRGYVREHILLAEKAYGGPLPEGVQVHHHGQRNDNTKLVICQDQEYHSLLHIRAKALEDCGDANKRKCKFCKEYDFIKNLYCKKAKKGWNVYHTKCVNRYQRLRKIKIGANL